MTPLAVVASLAALVALATVLGLVWQRQNGRVRHSSGTDVISPVDVAGRLGTSATLLQFSSEVCAPCVATHRVLTDIAGGTAGVAHVEIDITARPDLVSRFNILQTPTTLLLDKTGTVRARIGGAARPDTVRAELARIAAAA